MTAATISLSNVLILAGVVLLTHAIHRFYRFVSVPPALRQFPRVPIWDFIRHVITRESYLNGWRKYYKDRFKDSKYIVAFTPLGWRLDISSVEIGKFMTTNYDLFHHNTFKKLGREGSLVDRFIGTNVVLVDGEDWHRMRPIINSAFTKLKPTYAAAEATQHMIKLLKDKMGQPINIDPYMRRTMFRALLNAIFDLPELLENDGDERLAKLIDDIFSRGISVFFLVVGMLDKPMFRPKDFALVEELDALILSLINKKRQELQQEKEGGEEKRDLISLLLKASMDPENASLTDEELIGNVKTLFFAGHETTASALGFVMQLLAIHQDVQEKVRQEVFQVLGSSPGQMVVPTPEQQRDLVYLNVVVREANRLFPPSAEFNDRLTSQDVTLPDGTFLPKDTLLTLHQWDMLHSDKVWKDPEVFRPERHLGDEREGRTNNEYIVFGAGKRICPGMNLANVEQRIMVSLCVQLFRWELADPEEGKEIKTGTFFVVRPANANLKLFSLVADDQ